MKRTILVYISLILFSFECLPANTIESKDDGTIQSDTAIIFLRDYGIDKLRKKDCTTIIKNALKEIDDSKPTIIRFPRGEYHFYQEESSKHNYLLPNENQAKLLNSAIFIENRNNLIIDGNGSKFIFHNQIQPFAFNNCINITLRNFTIDWEQPLTAQARITKVNDEFIELAIDLKEYPYRLENGKLLFAINQNMNETWKRTIEFDRDGRFIVPQTGNTDCFGKEWQNYIAEDIIPGVVRLYYPFLRKPKIGNILVLQHTKQNYPGIYLQDSKNVAINNVNIFHAPGVGVLAQNCGYLNFNDFSINPNKINSRYYSSGSGGFYISECYGDISINNCEFDGVMGDVVTIYENLKTTAFEKTSEISITDSKFKSSRGSGIHISSVNQLKIENNIFESGGSAILFSGSNNEVSNPTKSTDILIKNNQFTDLCNSGMYNICEGIISIHPEFQSISENTPKIYSNIKIISNRFNTFDYSVLFARLVDGLTFEENLITKSSRFEPFHNRTHTLTFESCKNILINSNTISEDVLGKNIQLKWMNESELTGSQTDLKIR